MPFVRTEVIVSRQHLGRNDQLIKHTTLMNKYIFFPATPRILLLVSIILESDIKAHYFQQALILFYPSCFLLAYLYLLWFLLKPINAFFLVLSPMVRRDKKVILGLIANREYNFNIPFIRIALFLSQQPSSSVLPTRQTAFPNAVKYCLTNLYAVDCFCFIISINIMSQALLAEITKMAQQGQVSQGIKILKNECSKGQNYSLLCNLGALYLQAGNIESSIESNCKAITIDPFSYIAYYNRFICYFAQEKLSLAWGDIQRALSCLYLLKGYQENKVKYLNKAIFYCQQNAKAYLVRAKLNQGKNNKLAENDYEIAIEYAPNLTQIYQQRALFYRKLGRTKQFQENFANYISLKGIGAKHTSELAENQNDEPINYSDKIVQAIRQFESLLAKAKASDDLISSTEEAISKLPLDSVQSKIDAKQDQQMLLSDRPDVDTAKTIEIRKEEINFKKRTYEDRLNKNFDQIFQDQNSKELNEEIQKLQKQIKAQGGKLSLQEDQQLDVSDPSNFLTAQIEKAIEQITKLTNRDNMNQVKSVRSANSHGSVNSRGGNKEITAEQFKRFRKFQIQIIDVEDLQDVTRKYISKVVLRYRDREFQTQNSRFEWNKSFTIGIELDCFELQVEVIVKGGVFMGNTSLGEGTISLLEVSQSKCILGSRDKKTAILNYKLSLM